MHSVGTVQPSNYIAWFHCWTSIHRSWACYHYYCTPTHHTCIKQLPGFILCSQISTSYGITIRFHSHFSITVSQYQQNLPVAPPHRRGGVHAPAATMNNTYSLPSISQQLGGPLPPPQGAPHMPHTSQGHHTAHLSQPSRPSMSGPTTQPQTMTQPTVAHPWELQGTYAGKKYQLLVEQQPLRARMCGFGDKVRHDHSLPSFTVSG